MKPVQVSYQVGEIRQQDVEPSRQAVYLIQSLCKIITTTTTTIKATIKIIIIINCIHELRGIRLRNSVVNPNLSFGDSPNQKSRQNEVPYRGHYDAI